MSDKKKIMIVDDSALMRRVLCDIINSIEGFEVAKTCKDGVEALEALQKTHYDAMLLDVEMPRMDGIRLLMEIQDRDINITTLMASSYTTENADITIRCMELGAVDFVAKPHDIAKLKTAEYRNKIANMLKVVQVSDPGKLKPKPDRSKSVQERYDSVMSALSAARRKERAGTNSTAASNVSSAHSFTSAPTTPTPAPVFTQQAQAPVVTKAPLSGASGSNRVIALACSTGGPKSLQSVIPFLEKNMDAPCVLVQHMPVGFTRSLAERLNELSKVDVTEAVDGDILQKGHVYIAPGGRHLEVVPEPGGVHRIRLNDAPAIGGLRPCANVMYKSLVNSHYDEIVCVVLTGMGADGTEGIVELSKSKKIYVISQDAKTSIVYGMPKAIAETGLSNEVLPLEQIAGATVRRVGLRR